MRNIKKMKKPSTQLNISHIDADILAYVYKYRFLTTDMLFCLLDAQERSLKRRVGKSALYKHLKKLYDGNYLKRYHLSDLPIGGSHGLPRAIYGLGIKSSPVLVEHIGISKNKVSEIVRANNVKSHYLRHALELAEFQITLELACKQSDGKVRILEWHKGRCLLDSVQLVNEKGEKETYSVYPDAFFTLLIDKKKIANYFLEVDRGTMPIVSKGIRTDIRKKIITYMKSKKSRKFQDKYFYFTASNGSIIGVVIRGNSCKVTRDQLKHLYPIKGFTVLFVVPGEINEDGFIKGRINNILDLLPRFGKSYNSTTLFWFTVPGLIDIKQPQLVFSSIWIAPNLQKRNHSLIE